MASSPRVYGYGDGGFEDGGFGCSYRNAQTLLGALGIPEKDIPSVREMMASLNVAFDRGRPLSDMWIEPLQVRDLVRAMTGRKLRALVVGSLAVAESRMLRNVPEDYDDHVPVVEDLHDLLRASLRGGVPVVVDDGIGSYIVLGVADDGGGYVVGDPHRRSDRLVVWSRDRVSACPLWMVLLGDGE